MGVAGRDLTPLFRHPHQHVQDEILFTYDDQFGSPPLTGAGHIRCIRETHWKFALYFAPWQQPSEYIYEMYDLKNDPTESHNLAFGKLLPRYKAEYERLLKKLNAIMEETGTLPQDYKPPDRQVLDPIAGV